MSDLDTLLRHALSVAFTTSPPRRQQLFSLLPPDTFKGPALYFNLGRFFATDTTTEDFGSIAKATKLDPVDLVSLSAEDESYRPLQDHLVRLLTERLKLASQGGEDVIRWSVAMVKVSDALTPTGNAGRNIPALKTGRDLRALDIKIEWLVEGVIPRGAVILLYGRGGIGKTTLMMMLADAIDRGASIFGMATVRTQVIVVDFENSLAVLSERAKRTTVDGVLFWDSGDNPPSLDKGDWTTYQELLEQYPGAVFVFDTLRSAHSGDENNSEVMTLIMRRMRMLRDAGATVILLHHTPKGNDRQFKGSGAIFDLCDQTLALYQTAKPGSDQEASDDDDDTEKVYRFGTGKKTRYRPHRVFLSFNTEQEVFTLAKNPDDEALEYMHAIVCQVDARTSAKQMEIVKAATDDGGFDFGGEKKIRALLKRGIDRYWTTDKGLHNSIIYHPIQFGSLADPIGEEKPPNQNHPASQSGNIPEKQTNKITPKSATVTEFGRLAKGSSQTGKHPGIENADFSEIPTFTEADFLVEVQA